MFFRRFILKILCINPNSSQEVTAGIESVCKNYALPTTENKSKMH
jgi:Asp/Glu/hydantoin racemase